MDRVSEQSLSDLITGRHPDADRLRTKVLSALQGASNAAASTVSAPVDLLNWGLGKVGLGSQEPVGGEDWMRRQGFMQTPANRNWGLAGETVGNIIPIVAQAKQAQIAKGLLTGAENLAKPQTLHPETGAVVWHGTGHDIPPTGFDPTKIGTGEGAQVYGHGHYMGGAQKTGQFYADTVTEKLANEGGIKVGPTRIPLDKSNPRHIAAAEIDNYSAGTLSLPERKEYALEELHSLLEDPKLLRQSGYQPYAVKEAISLIRGGGKLPEIYTPTPNLYKIDLPDKHINEMLNLDQNLGWGSNKDVHEKIMSSGDPLIKDYLKTYLTPAGHTLSGKAPTGMHLVSGMSEIAGPGEASEALRKAGIAGNKYADAMTRFEGGSSKNYVLYPGNESMATFLERNGIPIQGYLDALRKK